MKISIVDKKVEELLSLQIEVGNWSTRCKGNDKIVVIDAFQLVLDISRELDQMNNNYHSVRMRHELLKERYDANTEEL